jgi:Ca2+-binding RTX toxin-like protein
MANIAGSAFGGRFAAATFVGFASPIISTAAGILNLGVENDPIYKAINGYADFPSSLDNLVLATSEYMAGNYDGFHPLDFDAHSSGLGFAALGQLAQSKFYEFMTPDSVVIFDANVGLVQDVTPGRENTGAFYLGENVADSIAGRNGNDFLEGFGGDDILFGNSGTDALDGGGGIDMLLGGTGNDTMTGGIGNDVYWLNEIGDLIVENSGEGTDAVNVFVSGYTLTDNVEVGWLVAAGGGTLTGNGLDNMLHGSAGADVLNGASGMDTLNGYGGNDTFVFAGAFGSDVVNEFHQGEDTIEFQVAGVSDFDDLVITDTAIGTVISTTVATDTVTLVGFHDPLTPLTASDFLFS